MNNVVSKSSGLFVMLVGVLLVLVIGYFSFQSFTGAISGPSSSSQMNATMNVGNTVFNVGGIFLVVVAMAVILGFVYYRVSTPERYQKFSKLISFLNVSTYYFGWGLLSFVAVAIPGYLLWLLFQYTIIEGRTGSLFVIGKWILVGIVVYFALAGFGYVIKKKVVDNWRKRQEEHKDEEIAKGLDKTMG